VSSTAIKTLAVVTDDGVLTEQLRAIVGAGHHVVTVPAQAGAAEVAADLAPAVILLDLAVDEGLNVLRRLAAQPRLRGVPVIVLSATSDYEIFEKAHRLGAAEFVTMPFATDDLRGRIEALASGSKQPAAGRLKLGALLVASGLITQQQLDVALDRQRHDGGRVGQALVRSGLLTEQEIVTAVAGQMRIGVADLSATGPQASAIALLPRDFIVRHRLMPLHLDDGGALHLAMTDPLDIITIDEVSMRTKRRVVPVICTESAFDEAVTIYFSSRGKLRDAHDEAAAPPETGDVDADIVELVDTLLSDAANMDASDIHLEPREDSLHVRCRIDGVLHPLREYPRELQAGITSRLKIMGNMNIAERRLPQDGRITFELSSGEVADLRLASIPSQYGENMTLRILEASALPPTLESLGFDGANLERYAQALAAPEGGIVIVGPTGSGKSTTLYTTLELIKTPERKVYTVEDPIERKIQGIVQTEVRPLIGLTFAQALRALVRADPDVIMVGEIRDLETAKMAADAAVTGHQVFSTLHTSSASAAVNRLVEMGVPRYLVAAAWRCFVAQRLVRRLCPHCRQAETITAERWEELGLGPAPKRRLKLYRPVGCSKCFGTGYRGRIGLYEVLLVDDAIRELIATGATVLDIERAARAQGVRSLRDDGVDKVLDGLTSHLELLRATI
jgi:type IV pilus assembly protein PilB